jgi:hypothetical protein
MVHNLGPKVDVLGETRVYPRLVWQPRRRSLSPFYPFRMIIVAAFRLVVTGLVLLWVIDASAQNPTTLSIEQLRNGIENQHPSYFYILAGKLFVAGKKDEAVFWFYAGQLRYRVYLLVNKNKLDPSGDPALFASLSEEIGRPLNEYAFGDIPRFAKTIDAVLAWDQSHPNPLTPREKYRSAYDQIAAGLIRMRDEVVRKADSIRKTRAANGLENRS